MIALPFRKYLLVALGVAVIIPVTAHVVTASFAPACASQPRESWLSTYELGLRLQRRGYEIVRITFGDARCVGVVVRDKDGRFVDLIVNPFNAEIVKTSAP